MAQQSSFPLCCPHTSLGRLPPFPRRGKASRNTRYAREKGYPAATAYIPPQTAVEGSLVVRIAPGRFGNITVENDSGLKDSVAEGILAGLHAGDIIKSRTLETALQNLRELSGIEVYGVLSPGREEGTSDLTVKVAKGKKNSLIVYTENYGSRTAGRYRYGLQGELGNLSARAASSISAP